MIVEIRDEVVALSGALVRDEWLTLQSAVNVRLKHHPGGIVVDCGGLTALTPEGAETFRRAFRHVGAGGGRIVVASIPPEIMWVIRRVPDLGSQLPVAATVAEARASLGLGAVPRRHIGDAPGTIVAGLLGTNADGHAVAVACRLAQAAGRAAPEGASAGSEVLLYLVYLLLVPRNMPLLSAMGPEEEAARGALEELDTAVRAVSRLRSVGRVERTRDPGKRLVEVAGEVRAETVVLALPSEPTAEIDSVARSVLAQAPCDVVINRLAAPAAAAPAASVSPIRIAPIAYDPKGAP
jgi:nucleotide-binding universal stress UspA family protein/anti-anti-sigma regulatory factor